MFESETQNFRTQPGLNVEKGVARIRGYIKNKYTLTLKIQRKHITTLQYAST